MCCLWLVQQKRARKFSFQCVAAWSQDHRQYHGRLVHGEDGSVGPSNMWIVSAALVQFRVVRYAMLAGLGCRASSHRARFVFLTVPITHHVWRV